MAEQWEQQPGEAAEAYRAFCVYRDLGADRSVDVAYARYAPKAHQKRTKRAAGHWKKWSADHDWPERARAYDAHMAAIAQAERERVAAEEAAKWERRRQEEREAEWQAAKRLRERAEQMLAQPLLKEVTEVSSEDGKTIAIHLHPARWTMRDIAAYYEQAAKLARLAAEMEGERKLVGGMTGDDGKPIPIAVVRMEMDDL